MKGRGFRPEEVLFSPTTACNLVCAHCGVRAPGKTLSVNTAARFLRQAKKVGSDKIGFTGGEPFLAPDFLCALTKEAVKLGMSFDRIMTNGVWWPDEETLKATLIRLNNAGYDGSICISVDSFHKQDVSKAAAFISVASKIWRRADVVSIAYVRGSRDSATKNMITRLERAVRLADPLIVLRKSAIDLSPTGIASKIRSGWNGRWFSEDYCQGPGNVFYVLPNGDVKPCCGYATDHDRLTVGNISRDSAKRVLRRVNANRFVKSVFNIGLSGIRDRLVSQGITFPGKTANHCFFCDHILSKVPPKVLSKVLVSAALVLSLAAGSAYSSEVRKGPEFTKFESSVVKRLHIPKHYHEGLFYDGKSLILANGEGGDIWSIDPSTGIVRSNIKPVGDFPEAMIKVGDDVYTTEWNALKVYRAKMDGNRLAPDAEISLAPAHPAGVAWDGEKLYVVSWTRGFGTKFHLIELDRDLNIKDSHAIEDIQEPDQLAWDGDYLWVSSWYTKAVYKIDVDKMEILGYFASPVPKTTGIAWDGKHMWLTGTDDDLYQIEVASNFRPVPGA